MNASGDWKIGKTTSSANHSIYCMFSLKNYISPKLCLAVVLKTNQFKYFLISGVISSPYMMKTESRHQFRESVFMCLSGYHTKLLFKRDNFAVGELNMMNYVAVLSSIVCYVRLLAGDSAFSVPPGFCGLFLGFVAA